VENSRYRLIEKLASKVLCLIMKNDRVTGATVRINKPQALCYAKSVALEMCEKRK
jgi:dihydroneopterin aldolase